MPHPVPGPPPTRVALLQGQARVSGRQDIEFSTVLGSCIATCLFDPEAQLGGMNHFLLAGPVAGRADGAVDEHHGIYLMQVLVSEMLARGASRAQLRARLYGGANLHAGMANIGATNADFAHAFLAREHIALVHEDIGGAHARHIDFRPALGKVRCRIIENPAVPDLPLLSASPCASGDAGAFQQKRNRS